LKLKHKKNWNKTKTGSKNLRGKLRSKNDTTMSVTKKLITKWMRSRCKVRLNAKNFVTYMKKNCWRRSVSLRRRCTLTMNVTRSFCILKMNRRRSSGKSCRSCIWFKKSNTKRSGLSTTCKSRRKIRKGKSCKLR
jgi:hypothetical protein